MGETVRASAPGSIANLGCLFDVGGAAIGAFRDFVEVRREGRNIKVKATGPVPGGEWNVAHLVAEAFLSRINADEGVLIHVIKGVPVSAGLGSSGATAAATTLALNELFQASLGIEELLEMAARGEALVAGEPHYDNVAASLVGGVVMIDPQQPARLIKIKPPEWLRVVIFLRQSNVSGKTRVMRKILPKHVPLRKASMQVFASAALAWGFLEAREEGLKYANVGGVVEEVRAAYIENYWKAKEAALNAGALAFNISGAGPSLFALVKRGQEDKVAESVLQVLKGYSVVKTCIDVRGAVIED